MATLIFVFSHVLRALRARKGPGQFRCKENPAADLFPPMSRDELGEERQSSPKLKRGSLIERPLTDTSYGSCARP